MNEAALPSVSSALQPKASKQAIDAYLLPVIAQRIEEARTIEPAYAALWQTIEHLFKAGGKRFRSYMTLLIYEAYSNGPLEPVLPAAAAQELLHLATLIHDDIIDRDDIRYGVKNVGASYKELYQSFITDEHERAHYAESAAILAGDLLLSEAYLQVTQSDTTPESIVAVQKLMAKAMFNVIGGELLDTEAAFKKVASAHPLVIAEYKTASYSFVTPFYIGATLAGASDPQKELLSSFGTKLGIAYQMRDDIMGAFGDQAVTGKSTDGDIREGKRTFLIDEFYRQATAEQRQEFDTLFGNPDTDTGQIEQVRTLLKDSGALQHLEDTIMEYQQEITSLVDQFDIDNEHKASLHALIRMCLQRDK